MKSNIEIVSDYLKGERPLTIVGYQPEAEKKHAVGEQWTDSKGREWIQAESGPVRVTKLDGIREEIKQKCTCCGAEIRWGTRHDTRFYYKTGKCFDCLVKEETQMRIDGIYPLYEQRKTLENQLAYLRDVKKKLRESYDYTVDHKVITYVNSNGMVEEWANEARDDLMIGIKKDFSKCLKLIKEVELELKSVKKQFIDAQAAIKAKSSS